MPLLAAAHCARHSGLSLVIAYLIANHLHSVGLEILSVLQMSTTGIVLSACIFLAV
jgi:hypothetical protein